MEAIKIREWLFIEEFADEVRMPVKTVRQRINEGAIRASKPGKRLMIHRSEIEKLMKRFSINP